MLNSHVARLFYAHSTVWICYGQAHENSTCLYLPFSNTKAWHWGLKQKSMRRICDQLRLWIHVFTIVCQGKGDRNACSSLNCVYYSSHHIEVWFSERGSWWLLLHILHALYLAVPLSRYGDRYSSMWLLQTFLPQRRLPFWSIMLRKWRIYASQVPCLFIVSAIFTTCKWRVFKRFLTSEFISKYILINQDTSFLKKVCLLRGWCLLPFQVLLLSIDT